jgi:hypothetical protein
MNNRKHIQEELKELNSALPFDAKEPVFSVPNNYFENFAASVLQKIKEESAPSAAEELASLSPTLAGLSKKMPFSIPENFFTTLENDIPALIQEDTLPASLAGLDKKMPFSVPAGYFENIPDQLLSKVALKQAKVISFNRTRWMRLAAAAIVTGVVAVSSIFYFNENKKAAPEKQSETWVADKLQNVSNQDLEQFIETADISGGREVAKSNKTEVRTMMKDVSVKEMDAFLAQLPADDELNIN